MHKKRIVFLAKVLLSILLLYLIFRKIDLGNVVKNFTDLNISIIMLLLITTAFKKSLQIWNWQRFLKMDPEFHPNLKHVISTFFVGEALRFLLPGGYGIIGKIYFIDNKRQKSFLSIGLEKFFQVWTSLSLAAIAGLFYFKEIDLWIRLLINIIILSIPVIIIFVRYFVKHESFQGHLKQYKRYAPTIVLRSFIMMLFTICQYYLILNSFDKISFISVIIVVPLILSANLLPITYGGLGLRESFAIHVLLRYGINAEIAVTCSITIFILSSILPALIGIIFIIRSKRKN